MLLRVTQLAIPVAMLAGLLGDGVWGLLGYGAVAALVSVPLRLWRLEQRQLRALGGDGPAALLETPAELQTIARDAGLGPPVLWRVPGAEVIAVSWRWRRPVVLVGERLLSDAAPPPQALGALAHELAHVQQRDVVWRHAVGAGALFLVCLSLISPLGALFPSLLTQLALTEVGVLVCLPLLSWLGASSYSGVLRRLELRADRVAARWCGAARITLALEHLADDRPGWLFDPQPPRAERLARLAALR